MFVFLEYFMFEVKVFIKYYIREIKFNSLIDKIIIL